MQCLDPPNFQDNAVPKLKLGIRHNDILNSCDAGDNQRKIKLMIKGNDKIDEGSKLIGLEACKDIIPKFTAKFCKTHS